MQWFRLYNEFAFDPKIQSMGETFQRRFIMLLCLQCNGDLQKLSEEELAFALRISSEELQETKKILISKRFIDEDWNVLNWNKRQYVSDTSTERVRRFRQKQNETLQKRCETVTVTPPDTDTDTDTEKKNIVEKESRPTNNIPYKAIISYLNEKANTHFKHDTPETKRLIKARWNQGFKLDAFKYVVDVKCENWMCDEKMVAYLRPATLFGTKFESYLNESIHE